MLPIKVERKVENDNYRALALYIADAKIGRNEGEKTLKAWTVGCQMGDYLGGMIEVEATQAMNTTSGKEKTYHLVISFRPSDEKKLALEDYYGIEKEIAKALGFADHQRHCGIHRNTDNIHLHIAYNMIAPEKFTRHSPYQDFSKLHSVCRRLEKKYGLEVDKGIEPGAEKDEAKTSTNVKAQTVEAHSGQESFYGYVGRKKPTIMAALETAKTWDNFHRSLLAIGLQIEARGAGLVIKNSYGKHRAVPSKIDRNLSMAKLEDKFGPFRAASALLKKNVKCEETYTALPLHQGPDRDNLYEEFKFEMAVRKSELERIKTEEGEGFQRIRQRWNEHRKSLQNHPMLYEHRQRLLLEIKIKEQEELVLNRAELAEKRQSIRAAIPYTSWNKCLQYKAAQGNEVALAILRSKNVEVAPEAGDKASEAPPQKTYDEITLESLARQREILHLGRISSTQRKALLAVEKMRELLEKETSFKNSLVSLKNYRIDTKGVVIFTLNSGESIRDTGKEIHFSAESPEVKDLAVKFAAAKWGHRTNLEGNIIKPVLQYERKIALSR